MARKGKPSEGQEALRDGIDALSRGRPAEGWVCREVLSLLPDCNSLGVVQALHHALHAYIADGPNRNLKTVATVVAAANELLKTVMEPDDAPVVEEPPA